jgi:hypothetical protein
MMIPIITDPQMIKKMPGIWEMGIGFQSRKRGVSQYKTAIMTNEINAINIYIIL